MCPKPFCPQASDSAPWDHGDHETGSWCFVPSIGQPSLLQTAKCEGLPWRRTETVCWGSFPLSSSVCEILLCVLLSVPMYLSHTWMHKQELYQYMHLYTFFNWLGAQISLAWESNCLPWNRKNSFNLPKDIVFNSCFNRPTHHFWQDLETNIPLQTKESLVYSCRSFTSPCSISVWYQVEAETIPSTCHFTNRGIQS